jgi:hypothetical protein
MTVKYWIAAGLTFVAIAGCNKKSATGEAAEGGPPPGVAAWMPKDAAAAWEGAWVSRMRLHSSKKSYSSMAGDPVALEIKGGKVTAFGGDTDQQLTMSFVTPCVAQFEEPITEGSMKGGTSFVSTTFLVENGALVTGDGTVGYRKGKTAVVCSGADKLYLLDDKGTCKYWKKEFRDWQAWPDAKCTWSQKDGKDVLTVGEGESADVLTANGDLLATDSFREDSKRIQEKGYHVKAKDFADAKAQVTAKIKAADPGEQAKAKGGVAGKTDTVLSLIATLSSDPSLKGKQVELTAVYSSGGSTTSNGKKSHYIFIADSKETNDLSISCQLGDTASEGLVQWDKVTVKGTVGEAFGKPELEGCTASKAPL